MRYSYTLMQDVLKLLSIYIQENRSKSSCNENDFLNLYSYRLVMEQRHVLVRLEMFVFLKSLIFNRVSNSD
jgi:hypothetical protein